MEILLRIYFVGLISFIPGHSGDDMTIVLLDATEGYVASDDVRIHAHQPWLVARAGKCTGNCEEDNAKAADFFYTGLLVDSIPEDRMDQLHKAIDQGGAWSLASSDLALEFPDTTESPLSIHRVKAEGRWPKNAGESENFDWVAPMEKIAPEAAEVDADVLAARPKKDLVIARLKLDRGEIKTYRLVRYKGDVRPIDFKVRGDENAPVKYSRALAEWIVAEIPVKGCEVTLVDQRFKGPEKRRVMKLSPEPCREGSVIEVALFNLPQSDFQLKSRQGSIEEEVGRHFEMYYELSRKRLPKDRRPVPCAAAAEGIAWDELYPPGKQKSDFLDAITLPDRKTVAVPLLCPGVSFLPPSQ